jgi:hypothetical protein
MGSRKHVRKSVMDPIGMSMSTVSEKREGPNCVLPFTNVPKQDVGPFVGYGAL